MATTTRSAVLVETGAAQPFADSQPIRIEELELDPPGPNELMIRIGGAGLCHSDLSMLNGDRPRAVPMVLGHEGAGECVEVGPGVGDIRAGDHVVFQFSVSCGRCRRCLEGRPGVCDRAGATRATGELIGGGRRFRRPDGERLAHHSGVSCMTDYTVVDRGSCVVIDPDVPLDEAAIFGCAVMTGVGAVLNTARIRGGDSVAVVGLGGVGLNGLLGAVLAGAERIVAIDVNAAKLDLARELGATDVVDASDPDAVAAVRDVTHGGVDYAFELAGAVPAMRTAYDVTRRGGTVVSAGLAPTGAEFGFHYAQLVLEEKTIKGSFMGSCVPVRDIPRFISLYRQGRLPVDRLISSKVGMDELNEGFDRLQRGEVVRQILTP